MPFIPSKNQYENENLLCISFNLNKLEANILSFLRSRKATNLISDVKIDDLPDELKNDKNLEKSIYFLSKIGFIAKTKKNLYITKDGIASIKLLKDFNDKPNPSYEEF